MTSQYNEWKVCGTGPFNVSRNGIGVSGQWHVDRRGVAIKFKSMATAQRRAARLNQEEA